MSSEMMPANLDALVERIFLIEDVTQGGTKEGFLVRYRGKLRSENTVAAYDELAALLSPHQLTPLFRLEDGRHIILIIEGPSNTLKPANPRTNLIMFFLTLLSVWFTGGMMSMTELPANLWQAIQQIAANGWQFAVSMLAILLAHEFGHYLAGRAHGVDVSLPYLIPLPYPISPFGTMGAFINLREIPKNRRQLLDIGLAGPLAGIAVAIPVLLLGLSLSSLNPLPTAPGTTPGSILEGNSILYLLLKYSVFGQLLPAPGSTNGLPEILYWVGYFFTGRPLPYGGIDVNLHPVAWAGWAGLLITSLNLIPAGQLDGGHIFYTLFGTKWARKIRPFLMIFIALLGLFWSGWFLWLALIFFLGRTYAEPLDQITPLDTKRRILAICGIILFILVFTPIPLISLN